MTQSLRFTRIEFYRFKAFERYTLHLRHFNILVGPNNAGKSTILAAFRILAAAARRARARNPQLLNGPSGLVYGHSIDMAGISVAEENIFYNYDDSEPASVTFHLSNRNHLTLYFPEVATCYLLAGGESSAPRTAGAFRRSFDCRVGFVPILGPVDHREPLYNEEAARQALFNYTAARNFRNIWFHYGDKFADFRQLLRETWPGVDIEPPTVDRTHPKPVLHMFCPEERIPREIFWTGFGFQVWCQMLTHVVQSSETAVFLIDEPDIYLHADLQRQLIGLLRNLGPDIVIATHSTEIIMEAEADDIVLINKKRRSSRRIKQPSELEEVLTTLGSNLNPVLTQVAKTRRVVFVEGTDFQVISRFARKTGNGSVASRTEFAVVPVGGFNPDRMRSVKDGMEATLGGKVVVATILDRDYRSEEECSFLVAACEQFSEYALIHGRKEIENFLLVPRAIDEAARRKVADQNARTGDQKEYAPIAEAVLQDFVTGVRTHVTSRYLASRRRFDKRHHPGRDEASSNESALLELESHWNDAERSLQIVPGKEALSAVNQRLQSEFGVSITATAIIDAMTVEDVPVEMVTLIKMLDDFSRIRPGSGRKG